MVTSFGCLFWVQGQQVRSMCCGSTLLVSDGLIQFLVHEKSFNEDRVRKALDRIAAAKSKASQGRLESFFGPAKIVSSTSGKRKEPEAAKGKGSKAGAPKKGKLGAMGKKK